MDRADHRIGSICHPDCARSYELHGILNEENPQGDGGSVGFRVDAVHILLNIILSKLKRSHAEVLLYILAEK